MNKLEVALSIISGRKKFENLTPEERKSIECHLRMDALKKAEKILYEHIK